MLLGLSWALPALAGLLVWTLLAGGTAGRDGLALPLALAVAAVAVIQAGAVHYVMRARRRTEHSADTALSDTYREERNFLQAVIDAIPDPIFVKSASHEWISVNNAFAAVMGRSKSELVGWSDRQIISSDLAAQREEEDDQVMKAGKVLAVEQDHRHPDGSSRVLLKRKAPVDFPDGTRGVVGILTDITQEKTAEREVRNARTLLDAVMSAVPVPVTVKDPRGRYIFVNDTACDFLRQPRSAFIGRSDSEVFPLSQDERADEEDDRARASDRVLSFFNEIQPEVTGTRRYVKKYKRGFTLPDGERGVVVAVLDITDAYEAREEAERSRRFLDAVIDAVPIPFFVKNRDHRVVKMNPMHAKAIGIDLDKIVGKRDEDFISADLAAMAYAEDDQVFNTGKPLLIEHRTRLANSLGAWRLTHKALVVVDDQQFIVGVGTDITALKQAQEATERHRHLLDAVIDAIPIVVSLKNEARRIVMINNAVREFHGLPPEYFIGKSDSDFYPPEQAERIRKEDDILLATGGKDTYSGEFLTGKGERRWVIRHKKAVSLPDGTRGLVTALLDVSRMREAVEEAEQSRAFLDAIINAIPVPVFVKDASHRWVVANESFVHAVGGRSRAGLLGKTDHDLLPKDFADRAWREDVEVLGSDRVLRTETMMPSGRWYHKTKVSITLTNEQRYVIGSYLDVTDSRTAQMKLQEHRDELEGIVNARTAELISARDAAEAANRAKSEFLANMSHELRTPMHAVLSFARLGLDKMALDPVPLEKLKTYLSRIDESGNRLMVLLNDLLDLAKLEAGRMNYEFKDSSLLGIAQGVATELEGVGRRRDVAVAIRSITDNTVIRCDAVRIGQVIRNLLSNAIKFSPEGGLVNIDLSATEVPVAPGHLVDGVQMIVSDRGIGIPEDEIEAVFDKFVQSSKTKSGAGGTGLGLAITKEIVSQHQGFIYATNRPDGGAAFIVLLPRRQLAGNPDPARHATVAATP